MKKLLVSSLAVLLLAGGMTLSAFEMKKGEKAFIILPEKSIPAEENAAKILKSYLDKMMKGSSFVIVKENKLVPGTRKLIYVGLTGKVSTLKIDTKKLGREELLIASNGKDLFLSGGRNHGALYAVSEFLEREGVIYAAKDTCYIPAKTKISYKGKILRKTPAFKSRTAYTALPDSGAFRLFHKSNTVPKAANGGYVGTYSRAGSGHTFIYYSKKFPKDDPKVFAYSNRSGTRRVPAKKGDKAPLCLTYPKTADLIFAQMEKDYKASLVTAKKNSTPVPDLYELSLDDDRSACTCPNCVKAMKEEGCISGVMLRLANDLAGRLKKLDPRLKVSMLVYQQTLYFPKKTKPAENVVPRICVHDNEWIIDVLAESIDPYDHKNNVKFRKVLDSWLTSSRQSGIWEYWTYYTKPRFPHVALDVYCRNLKYYKENRVEHMFLEFEKFQDSFFALKYFLAWKMMDDPYRDSKKLINDFMGVYYGKGAPFMKEYLYFLNNEVRKETMKTPIGPRHPKDYGYLNEAFYKKAYGLLAKAEKAAAKDARSLKHIRFEYVVLDYSLFIFREKMMKKLGLTKKQVLARLQKYGTAQIEEFAGKTAPRAKREMASLNNFIVGNSIEAPLPKGIKGDEIFDFKFNSFYVCKKHTFLVKDPDAVGGQAVLLRAKKDNKVYSNGKYVTYHKAPFPIGIYNSYTTPKMGPQLTLKPQDIPQDEKYHVYKVGRHFLVNGSRLFFHWTWYFQFHPREAYLSTPDYYSNIYISLKFTGPAYVKGSKKENGVYVDRVIVTRNKDDMLRK